MPFEPMKPSSFEPIKPSSFQPIEETPTSIGTNNVAPKKKKKGIFSKVSNFVGGVARPFTRVASSVVGTGVAVGATLGAGVRELAGDKDAFETILPVVKDEITKPRDMGIFGEDVTPYGFTREGEAKTTAGFTAELGGFGLEVASSLLGGSIVKEAGEQAVKAGAKGTLKKLAGQSFDEILRNVWLYGKQGGKAGAVGGAGAGLQEDENQIINAISGSAIGYGAGILLAGAGSVFAPVLSKLLGQPIRTAKGVVSSLTKPARKIGEKLDDRADIKADANDAIEAVKGIAVNTSKAESSARELINGGADPADVRMLSNFNTKELSTVLEMFDVAEKKAFDPIKNQSLPRAVLGRKANDFVLRIKEVADVAGNRLGELRKGLDDVELSPEAVSTVETKLLDVLKNRGLDVEDGKVIMTPDTKIAKSKLPFYQTAWDALSEGNLTPNRLDSIRQRLFAEHQDIVAGQVQKTKDKTLQSDVTAMRATMLDAIDEVIPGFREQTELYAKAEEAVNGWMKAIGLKGRNINSMKEKDLRKAFDDFSANALARLESNASQKMMDAIAGVTKIADDLGVDMGEDMRRLATMSITLEDLFDIQKLGSFKGRTKSAGESVAQKVLGTAKDVATVNVPGVATRLLEPLVGTFNPNQVKHLKALLESLVTKSQ